MSIALSEQTEFNGFTLQPIEGGNVVYYVLWRGGDVVAKGSEDTILKALRDPMNDPDYKVPREWEDPTYWDV